MCFISQTFDCCRFGNRRKTDPPGWGGSSSTGVLHEVLTYICIYYIIYGSRLHTAAAASVVLTTAVRYGIIYIYVPGTGVVWYTRLRGVVYVRDYQATRLPGKYKKEQPLTLPPAAAPGTQSAAAFSYSTCICETWCTPRSGGRGPRGGPA